MKPTTTLIIARHGNTFEDGELPRRVGARTDLPLTDKGRMQARALGLWLKDNRLMPDVVYSSTLRRTIETAKLAIRETGVAQPVYQLAIFDEIDYGPDENRTEDEVAARLGVQVLNDWDKHATVPDGWNADPAQIVRNWQGFAERIREHEDGEVVVVVTSNGVARFAPHLTGDFESFIGAHKPKLATGAIGVMQFDGGRWTVKNWNLTPPITRTA